MGGGILGPTRVPQGGRRAPVAGAVVGRATWGGVTMHTPGGWAAAVRRPSGEVVVRVRAAACLPGRAGLPVLRGLGAMSQDLYCAVGALAFAAEEAGLRGELAPAWIGSEDMPKRFTRWGSLGWTTAAFVAAAGIVAWLPPWLGEAACRRLCGANWAVGLAAEGVRGAGAKVTCGRMLELLVWALRLGLAATMWRGLRHMPFVRAALMYRTAAQQAVAAWEAGLPLEVESVGRMAPQHGRSVSTWACWGGVSFFVAERCLAACVRSHHGMAAALSQGLAGRLLLILGAVGLGYELTLWSAVPQTRPWGRALLAPLAWLQRALFATPSRAALEVAVVALRAALGPPEDCRPAAPRAVAPLRPLVGAYARRPEPRARCARLGGATRHA